MAVTVEYDIDAVKDMLTRLPGELRDKAMASAINKTADKAKTEMKRQIVAMYNLTSTEVGGSLFVTGANWRDNIISASLYPISLSGKVRGGRAMNVVHFLNGTSRGELTFMFKRSGATKIIDALPTGESKPFIGNAGRTVFRRVGKARTPIEPVQVIDIPQMFNVRSINEAVLAKAQVDMLVEVDRAVTYLLQQQG